MSVDLEAGGALATAGLAAREIDKHSGRKRRHKGPKPTHCLNCSSKLSGNYCWHCGQPAHVHRSLWHMFEETLHSVLHFDTKSWRTLPLLIFRPGVLTKRYIDGQRVKYVSPLALFLFVTFLMFFVTSMVGGSVQKAATMSATERAQARAVLEVELQEANAAIAKYTASRDAATDADDRADAEEELADAVAERDGLVIALTEFDRVVGSIDDTNVKSHNNFNFNINTGNKTIDDATAKVRSNPELAAYKLKNTAYKFSFMLIPISLPFLWLMFFWRPGVTVYDHTIFSLYSLSFMSLLFTLLMLILALPGTGRFLGYFLLVPPVHMFVHLRKTYTLGFFSSLWRTFALLGVAGTVFILFLVMIAAIAAR